jgi:hypothetical protein
MTLPATMPSKDAMVDIAEQWINTIAEKLQSGNAHTLLRDHIQELLRRGTLPTMAVIAAAHQGNPDADFALRKRIAEMNDRDEKLPTSLKGYNQEALFKPPLGRGRRGDDITDLWIRDIGIAIMVHLAVLVWNLRPTRNRASKQPSASTIVARAIVRRGFRLSEWQVEAIYRQLGTLAARLEATIPVYASEQAI